jgi:peptidoglycan/LPS O-acetylase OafA/YrhL
MEETSGARGGRDARDAADREARGHLPSLDGIRGLAILLVVLHNTNPIEAPASLAAKLVGIVVDWGWVGVQLFFVLSGLLITGILLDTAKAENFYSAFFARRILRIFPLYYAVLFAAFVVVPLVTGHAIDGAREQVWLWTYLSNWADPFGHSVPAFPHFWSLAVEEQFYLVWPFIVLHAGTRGVLRIGVALVVVAFLSRLALLLGGFGHAGPYAFTICRVDALALGAIAAVLLRDPRAVAWIERHARALGGSAIALFVAGAFVTHGYPRAGFRTQTVGYTLLALVFALGVFFAARSDLRAGARASWLQAPWLRTLGKYSYALYVFHPLLQSTLGEPLLRRATGGHVSLLASGVYMASMLAVSLAAAVVSYHLFERHFLSLKSRFVADRGEPRALGEPDERSKPATPGEA